MISVYHKAKYQASYLMDVVLDIDDTRSYGPETITIKKKPENDEVFYFSVHNYSDRIDRVSTSLSDISQAAIRIYQGNKPVKTFYVPTGKKGTVWKAFSIDSNGIQAIDDIYYSSAGDIK